MAVPSNPADVAAAGAISSTHMNSLLDVTGYLLNTKPVFKGQGFSNSGMAGISVATATNTTFGFGTGGSFWTTPNINVGSWTVQGSDADPESLVVPESGIYRITINARWDSVASGERFARLLINGSTDNTIYDGSSYESTAGNGGNNCSGLIDVASTTQLDVQVWQNSGSTIDCTVHLSAEWVQST